MSKPIRYNDTLDYKYTTCFTSYGVFTEKQIEYTSLPVGFFTYYITAGKDGIVSKIIPAQRFQNNNREITGTFICKAPLSGNAGKFGCAIDWNTDVVIHTDQEFIFEEYFGVPPSLDCQIENAYQRQESQIKAAKEKKRKRLNSRQIQLYRSR